jgi:hypothetical protein
MVELIKIDEYEWEVFLNAKRELGFRFRVPDDISELRKDKFEFTFDEDDCAHITEWIYDMDYPIQTPVFKLIPKLYLAIRSVVAQSGVTYFYFRPNTEQKARIYRLIARRLIESLHGNWNFEWTGEYYYFFRQDA